MCQLVAEICMCQSGSWKSWWNCSLRKPHFNHSLRRGVKFHVEKLELFCVISNALKTLLLLHFLNLRSSLLILWDAQETVTLRWQLSQQICATQWAGLVMAMFPFRFGEAQLEKKPLHPANCKDANYLVELGSLVVKSKVCSSQWDLYR